MTPIQMTVIRIREYICLVHNKCSPNGSHCLPSILGSNILAFFFLIDRLQYGRLSFSNLKQGSDMLIWKPSLWQLEPYDRLPGILPPQPGPASVSYLSTLSPKWIINNLERVLEKKTEALIIVFMFHIKVTTTSLSYVLPLISEATIGIFFLFCFFRKKYCL